jgi:hypothetical protein
MAEIALRESIKLEFSKVGLGTVDVDILSQCKSFPESSCDYMQLHPLTQPHFNLKASAWPPHAMCPPLN